MPFPNVERVIYKKNTLREVVCEVRYPILLSIETELPTAFQNELIRDYPKLESQKVLRSSVTVGFGVSGASNTEETKRFIFRSEDDKWQIILSSTSLALITTEYSKWDDFESRIKVLLGVFTKIYQVQLFSRIGLRYCNLIPEKMLDEGTAWVDHLKPHILGVLALPELLNDQIPAKHDIFTLKLSDDNYLIANSGIMVNQETKELAYLIDGDFYNEIQRKADVDDVITISTNLHRNASKFFRWCITDRLHNAMEPQPIE